MESTFFLTVTVTVTISLITFHFTGKMVTVTTMTM